MKSKNVNKGHWYYMGFSKNDIQEMLPEIRSRNVKNLKNISLASTIFFTIGLFYQLYIHQQPAQPIFFGMMIGFCLLIFFVTSFIFSRPGIQKYIQILVQIFQLTITAAFLFQDLICHLNNIFSIYMLLSLGVSILIQMLPHESMLTLLINLGAYILTCWTYAHENFLKRTPDTPVLFASFIFIYICIVLHTTWIYLRMLAEKIKVTKANTQLQEISYKDSLTGLYTRQKFYEEIQHILICRQAKQNTMACGIIDIENFKNYNVNYGHLQGDEALKQISEILKGFCCKYGITLCRWSGDEFIFVYFVKTSEDAQKIAQEILTTLKSTSIEDTFTTSHHKLNYSCAIHVIAGKHSEQWDELYSTTRELLSRAKQNPGSLEFSIN